MILKGKKVIVFVSEDFEDLEFWYLVFRLCEVGVLVYLVVEEVKKVYYGKYGVFVIFDYDFDFVCVEDYDGILVLGGWFLDKLCCFDSVLNLVCVFDKVKKLIG